MHRGRLAQADEGLLLARARSGDRDAFTALVAPYRRALHVHCYRMLGSLHDAEDILQESLFRAWLGFERFESRAPLRAWLYRIATNACLDALKHGRRRLLPDAYAPPDEPTAAPARAATDIPWIEPYPDELLPSEDGDPARRYETREAVHLAFITAIQLLSGRERAVLILRDALGFSARETAAIMGASLASVNSALARARAALARDPRVAAVEARPLASDEAVLVARYMCAWEAADVEALVALLRRDARMTMPPTPSWYAGRETVGVFFASFLTGELGAGSRLLPMRANGQPALAVYAHRRERDVYEPVGIKVLTIDDAPRIAAITGFTEPTLFPRFGLRTPLREDGFGEGRRAAAPSVEGRAS